MTVVLTTAGGDTPPPPPPDPAARVGDDGLTFIRQLIDAGYFDARMTPSLVLQLFNPGTLGSIKTATPDLTAVTHRKRKATVTSSLVKWRDTYTEVESGVTPAKRRFLRLDQAPSEASGQAVAFAVQQPRSNPLIAVSAEMDAGPGPNANEPYAGVIAGDSTGFVPGDSIPIILPNAVGATNEQVQAIGFGSSPAGHPRWTVDIKDRILDAEQRAQRLQKRMLGGALAGQSNTPSLLTQQGTSKGSQYRLNLTKFTYTGDRLDSPDNQADRTGDIFRLTLRLAEVWPDDVTVVLRINNHDLPHALEVTVPAGDLFNQAWLAVGTTKITTGDWYMLGITEPAAPPRLVATLAIR